MEKKLSIVDEEMLLDEVLNFIRLYGDADVKRDGQYRNGTTVFLVSAQHQPRDDLVEILAECTSLDRDEIESKMTAAYEHWCSTPESE